MTRQHQLTYWLTIFVILILVLIIRSFVFTSVPEGRITTQTAAAEEYKQCSKTETSPGAEAEQCDPDCLYLVEEGTKGTVIEAVRDPRYPSGAVEFKTLLGAISQPIACKSTQPSFTPNAYQSGSSQPSGASSELGSPVFSEKIQSSPGTEVGQPAPSMLPAPSLSTLPNSTEEVQAAPGPVVSIEPALNNVVQLTAKPNTGSPDEVDNINLPPDWPVTFIPNPAEVGTAGLKITPIPPSGLPPGEVGQTGDMVLPISNMDLLNELNNKIIINWAALALGTL
jgi:hypothetical protein